MPRRTIAEARDWLDKNNLSPAKRREYEKHLQRHVKTEVARLSVSQAEVHSQLYDTVADLKRAFTAVEQDLLDLERNSRDMPMTAEQYAMAFGELQKRRDRLHHNAMQVQSRIERYGEIEDDPEGYLDSLYTRFPAIKPTFPW